jgi:hypothetical protein
VSFDADVVHDSQLTLTLEYTDDEGHSGQMEFCRQRTERTHSRRAQHPGARKIGLGRPATSKIGLPMGKRRPEVSCSSDRRIVRLDRLSGLIHEYRRAHNRISEPNACSRFAIATRKAAYGLPRQFSTLPALRSSFASGGAATSEICDPGERNQQEQQFDRS